MEYHVLCLHLCNAIQATYFASNQLLLYWCLPPEDGPSNKRRRMGKFKFSDTWLDKQDFRAWLKSAASCYFEAYCFLCKK